MFAESLDRFISKVEGTVGAAVMGLDGISIEKRMPDPKVNVESIAAEYTSALRASTSAAQDVDLGPLEEMVVLTDHRIVVVQMITPEYFIFVLLKKDANLGRARFELKKARYALAKEFAV